ncbi:MAG: DUF3631 domain-containing protein [Proteobacteria bacterium]|nr:DUF3631 domain-containing protein [Pseudomonadota bacterium]
MQTTTIKAQRPRMKVIKLRSRRPATPMCNPAFAAVGKPVSRKIPSNRVIEKLLPATPKVASPKAVRSGSNIESRLAESLLSDIRTIFKLKKAAQLRSQSILDALYVDKKKPWATFCNGKEIGARQLASLLKPYGIHSRDLRFSGSAFKGYKREWFITAGRISK